MSKQNFETSEGVTSGKSQVVLEVLRSQKPDAVRVPLS